MAARRGGRWRWALAFGAVAVLLAAWLSLQAGADAAATTGSSRAALTGSAGGARPAAAQQPASAQAGAAAQPAVAVPHAPHAPPEGLDSAQWQQLQAALADHPQREAESQRIVAFLQLQHRVQAFVDARRRAAPRSELAALALPLQAVLPQHLARGELNAAEALRLQAALLAVTEPDAAAAGQALADWRERHVGGARPSGLPHEPGERAFARAQQTALANWQAGGARDARALEDELESLRRQHFDAGR